VWTRNAGMRLAGEITHRSTVPVVTPGQTRRIVHTLLHHRPVALRRNQKRVQIELKSIADSIVIHLRGQPAHARERRAIRAGRIPERHQFFRSLPRLPPAPAANIKAKFAGLRIHAALQRAQHRRSDSRGMPVHAHHRAERLEPKRIADARKKFAGSVFADDRFHDGRAQHLHPLSQPNRHMAAMQRQVGKSGTLHRLEISTYRRLT